MNNSPLVSVITVNYNQASVTAEMLHSISQLHYKNFEVIVVDNASIEPAGWLKDEFPSIIYVSSRTNGGFAAGNNLGLRYAKGEYVLFLNNDTELTPDLLTLMVEHMQQNPQCAIACPKIKLYHRPDIIQYAGAMGLHPVTSRSYDVGFHSVDTGLFDDVRRTDLPNGAAMMVPMRLIMLHGPMSENFFLYYEEIDWAARFKAAGYEVHYVGKATVFHKESISSGRNSALKTYYLHRNRLLYIRRNYSLLNQIAGIGFYVAIAMPVHLVKHLLKGEWLHAKSIWQALHWNLQNRPFASPNENFAVRQQLTTG